MPNHLNLTVVGHASRGPMVNRSSKTGKEFVVVPVAVNSGKGGKNVTWIQILCMADFPAAQAKHAYKGCAVMAMGIPFADKYVNGAGATVATLKMFANEFYIIDYKKMSDGGQGPQPGPSEDLPESQEPRSDSPELPF